MLQETPISILHYAQRNPRVTEHTRLMSCHPSTSNILNNEGLYKEAMHEKVRDGDCFFFYLHPADQATRRYWEYAKQWDAWGEQENKV